VPGMSVETDMMKRDVRAHPKVQSKEICETYRYIQFDVSKFGLPVIHSGAKVIQPALR
jgi:hypothetical protein